MEWNTLLLWLAGSSCLINLLNAARSSPPLKGWMLVSVTILASAVSLYFLRFDISGYVAGGLWIALVLAPALLQRRVQLLTLRQRFPLAARLAKITRVLHPFDGMWQQPTLLRALELAEEGDTATATALLEKLQTAPLRVSRTAAAQVYRIDWRWSELVEWVRSAGGDQLLRRDLNLLAMYLRALGECGRLDEMLATLDRHRARLDSPAYATARHLSRLHAFAFTGEVERVYTVLCGPLRNLPPTFQQFWLATAELASGWHDPGTGRLLTIEEASSPGLRRAIARRLTNPPAIAATTLSETGRAILHRLEQDRDQEERYSSVLSRGRRPWVTYALILANIGMFIAEWRLGGTMNETAHVRLGAFRIDLADTGQYWRVLTANFLHFGAAHILLNMLALYVLGPFVEFAVGAALFLWLYLASGMLAIGTVWFLQHLLRSEPDILVGASGAIMGLVGATASILLRGWARERARIARRRLGVVVLIILLQSVFDQLTPQVSATAHLAGAVWGFLLTSLIPHRTTRRDQLRIRELFGTIDYEPDHDYKAGRMKR